MLIRTENQKIFGNSKKIYAWYGVAAVSFAIVVAVAVVVSDSKFVRTITRVNMDRIGPFLGVPLLDLYVWLIWQQPESMHHIFISHKAHVIRVVVVRANFEQCR